MALSRQTKIGLYIAVVTLFVSLGVYAYQLLFAPNLQVQREGKMLYIPTGSKFDQVIDSLNKYEIVGDEVSFRVIARAMGYMEAVKPGAYLIPPDANNLEIVRMLINGRQTPVKLTFNNIRLPTDLARKLGERIEADSTELLARLSNADTCAAYGFSPATITAMFLPNTYEVYWNLAPTSLWKKMQKAYVQFWDTKRLALADSLHMTPVQITTLASIVEAETKKVDEMPIVAGVYLNRLKLGMKLQADPTVVYALQDFSIKRVRLIHMAIASPYNTYFVAGLPPGPINLPRAEAIDAVLSPAKHDFIFFVAKKDFSGYHTFAKDYAKHLENAREYQAALDELKL